MPRQKMVEYFGPVAWGPVRDNPEEMIPAPTDTVCQQCKEPIAADDSGVRMWLVHGPNNAQRMSLHRECHLRNILGSVGHQRKLCPCYGGVDDDPVGMTPRQAARAACALAGVPGFTWEDLRA